MTSYLTIGEFADLRNLDRKSLRYYERIGALIPAYIDPQTKYRYYKLEQLVDLDTILVCLELGIPAKNAVLYKNSDGTLNISKLFQDGQARIREKMSHLSLTLEQLETSLHAIRENQSLSRGPGPYFRYFPARFLLRSPFAQPGNEELFRRTAASLFRQAQALGLVPLINFPIGIMAERHVDGIRFFVTLQLLASSGSQSEIFCLPEGNYQCSCLPAAELYDPAPHCHPLFEQKPALSMVALFNLSLEYYPNGLFPLEIQAFTAMPAM